MSSLKYQLSNKKNEQNLNNNNKMKLKSLDYDLNENGKTNKYLIYNSYSIKNIFSSKKYYSEKIKDSTIKAKLDKKRNITSEKNLIIPDNIFGKGKNMKKKPSKISIKNENIENGFKSNLNDKRTTVVEETKNIDRTQQKINELRERERILLDKKSEILRRYLSENVIPLISKGILNICQNLPDDPVESLAKFLSEIENNENKEKEEKNKVENEIIKTINESISF